MTQTLTTEQLNDMADGNWPDSGFYDTIKEMARELLANREAQPVGEIHTVAESRNPGVNIHMFNSEKIIPNGTKLYTAPPAPAVANGRTAEGWMAEALLQKKTVDDLRAAMLAAAPEGGK